MRLYEERNPNGDDLCLSLITTKGKNYGNFCDKRAYYFVEGVGNLCGVHSRKHTNRVTLETKESKRSKVKVREEELEVHCSSVEEVRFHKMKMMKRVPLVEGYLNVFPNNKHGKRKDGMGLPDLSPMRLGKVFHGQPNLPPAENIENFHQFSKKFRGETMEEFREASEVGYQDKTPHRRKTFGEGKHNEIIPECFIWVDEGGEENMLSYVESRQFYCNFYERLALETDAYALLLDLLIDGTNIQICGYDACDLSPDDVEGEYLNERIPFGHERVLAVLLWRDLGMIEGPLPWETYKTFNF